MTEPPDKPQPPPEPTPEPRPGPEVPQPPTEPVPAPPGDRVYPDATIPEPPAPPPTPPNPPAPPPNPQPPIPPTPPPPASTAGGAVYGGPPQPVASRGDGKRNLLGWLSLVFGILGTGCCCCPWLDGWPFLGGIPAVVLGILHLRRVKKGEATSAWLGWVGIILGVIALLGAIFGLATDWNDRIRTEYDRQF